MSDETTPRVPLEQFNIRDLALDVSLVAIVDGNRTDFTGKDIFSVEFFRQGVGFGITSIDIEVNTSLQPIITINFKDLYGNTVFGKQKDESPDSSQVNMADFSVLFNWPPPKFMFTFKGFLGRSATWMLNMKKSSVSYDSSDGSYDIKCEFVPNQWGFFSDLPFLYLLAVKALKKKANPAENIQTIFDLIKIGKKVEVKTQEVTKEFDGLLKQMTLIKSLRLYDAIFTSKVVNYDEVITGQVGNQMILPFNAVTINAPKGPGNTAIDTPEKMRQLAGSSDSLVRINTFLLLTAKIGDLKPENITYSQLAKGTLDDTLIPDLTSKKSTRIKIIEQNILNIDNAIKKKSYDSSKNQLEKITIGEVFKQLSMDAGYIMGRILEAGYQGYHSDKLSSPNGKSYTDIRNENKDKLIGKSFPMCLNDKQEEKPATKENAGSDFGVEVFEMAFVDEFINAISEGIATELAEENSTSENTTGDNFIKKRINNLEALQPNPYKPYYQSIAENIMIRSGIAGYLTRSSDPNRPGDYRRLGDIGGPDRATNAEDIVELANADFENITSEIIGGLSPEDLMKLKTFSTFWVNFLSEDCTKLRKPDSDGNLVDGPDVSSFVRPPGEPLTGSSLSFNNFLLPIPKLTNTILDYPVMIEKPAGWDGGITVENQRRGLRVAYLDGIMASIWNPRPNGGKSGSTDSTNSNFIDLNILQAIKVVNNGIAYSKSPEASAQDGYVFVMFSGIDANKTQQIMSANSDAEIKNNIEKEKKEEENPLGFINIQSPYVTGTSGDYLPVIDNMNDNRIGSNSGATSMLLDYSKMKMPVTNGDFYNNPTSLSGAGYFYINRKLGDPNNPQNGDIPASNITLSIAYHPLDDGSNLVFGPFVGAPSESDSLVQRGYIRAMCVKLQDKINEVEQKKSEVISNILGKAGEQRDLIYKQMHTLYQQWEVLIVKDSYSADNQNAKDNSKNAITNEMSERYSNHENFNWEAKYTNITSSVEGEAADNTFLYGYPLNNVQKKEGQKNINVRNSVINIDSLYKPNGSTTVLNIIQQICTKNNFIFIPMPGDPGSFSTSEIYSPHVTSGTKVKNFFYVQFVPTPESRATTGNNNTPVSASENAKRNLPDGTLLVKFGSPDNQIVKNITIDTQEGKPTAESIVNLQRLVDNENQNKKVTTDCSMLSVMEGRSYRATADMLGNAQVFPMQFFYLDSIPLFNGLYQIMKVKHSIKPNDMSTSAEGIRMRMDAQTGDFGGVPPVTLETLSELPVSLITIDASFTQQDFEEAVSDGGSAKEEPIPQKNTTKIEGVPETLEGCPVVPGTLVEPIIKSTITPNAYGGFIKGKASFINKVDAAYTALLIQGITLSIGDSYRSYDVQKNAYLNFLENMKLYEAGKPWVKNGITYPATKKPDNIAHPCKGYHVRGQAIDLNQTAAQKKDIQSHGPIYQALFKVGLRRIGNEWWHWSVGETTHDFAKRFTDHGGDTI